MFIYASLHDGNAQLFCFLFSIRRDWPAEPKLIHLKFNKIFVFIVTIRISNVDEVEADDVVAGVAIAGCGLVQAVNVEAGSEDRPDAQHLSFGKKSLNNT